MSQNRVTGLTFAEAFLLRKAKEVADGKRRKEEERILVSSIDELHSVLHKLRRDMAENTTNRYIKSMFKAIPPNFAKHIGEWTDEDMLDMIHHAIINNRAELITFFFSDTNFFPLRHSPKANPYCHLAAMLGHSECIRAIISHRPSAYFPCSGPNHAINLPDYVMKRIKANDKGQTFKTQTRIIDKIRFSTKAAERKMSQGHGSNVSDVSSVLNRDLGSIDKSFRERRKGKGLPLPVSTKQEMVKSYDPTRWGRAQAKPSTPDARNSVTKKKESLGKSRFRRCEPQADLPKESNHLIPKLKQHSGKHLITVYWDTLSNLKRGVVNGAGDPVEVRHCINKKVMSAPSIFPDEVPLHAIRSWPTLHRRPNETPRKVNTNVFQTQPGGSQTSFPKRFGGERKSMHRIVFGVRSVKKYKDFEVKLPVHEPKQVQDTEYINKTPLTFAAEKGHEDCVQLLLDMVILKRSAGITIDEPLTLATKARSPESIVLLLEKAFTRDDLQSAVLLAIREMYPVCLTALLSKGRGRYNLFEGANLFHILYSQCVMSTQRYELMPEMTRALIACKEDVNAHNVRRTYPMYTLINCAFNITIGKQIFFFLACLNILLEHKANPHFNEDKQDKAPSKNTFTFARAGFTSAINCIFESAKASIKYFEKSYWSKIFMKKFITTLEAHDRTPRRVLNMVLFEYMDAVCELGLDRTIVRCLLRYGANPDHIYQGKYAANVYFDNILPYMTRFEIIDSYKHFQQELDSLMMICRNMSFQYLSEAVFIFLQDHLLSAPIQALPITRQFAALVDQMLRNPRPLLELAARTVWLRIKRNKNRIRWLPIPNEFKLLIIP